MVFTFLLAEDIRRGHSDLLLWLLLFWGIFAGAVAAAWNRPRVVGYLVLLALAVLSTPYAVVILLFMTGKGHH